MLNRSSITSANRNTRRVIEVIIGLIFFFSINAWLERNMIKGSPPALEYHLLNGTPVNFQKMRGQPVLIHFWATWCGICKLEQDSIESINQDHHVITIAMQSGNDAAVTAHMAEHGLSFPVVNDETGATAKQFGVNSVPASFVMDPSGQITFKERGYTTEWGLRFRLWLSQILT